MNSGVPTGAFDWGAFLAEGPLFIGILNLTPDSFSDGGRHAEPEAALAQARRLLGAGFRMLDLGAESTRPGAEPLDPATEWARLAPVLDLLGRALPGVPLSLDTRHPEVAARGLAAGVAVLNDVTGFRDPALLALAAGSGCGLLAMRSRLADGRFLMPPYDGPGEKGISRALAELAEVRDRLRAAGIAEARVALDPGFGFGTTYAEDAALWEALPRIPDRLGWPLDRICVGISRKRFTAFRGGRPELPPAERDGLTAALQTEAHTRGLRIFRSHAATLGAATLLG
ncbi:MAG TPA: dihydropteroate synthase [Holophagaceae bacterium]|nr:dihydropteroate synthase [Holophagaceae bacterium]